MTRCLLRNHKKNVRKTSSIRSDANAVLFDTCPTAMTLENVFMVTTVIMVPEKKQSNSKRTSVLFDTCPTALAWKKVLTLDGYNNVDVHTRCSFPAAKKCAVWSMTDSSLSERKNADDRANNDQSNAKRAKQSKRINGNKGVHEAQTTRMRLAM